MTLHVKRCYECGQEYEFADGQNDEGIEADGEWLCKACTKTYSHIAGKMMIKSFDALPELMKKALADSSLEGQEYLFEYMEDYE